MLASLVISILLLFNFTFGNNLENVDDDVIVQIQSGKIRGKRIENYYSFESIPYAEPPIGENRFEPPKPFTKNWNDDVRDATIPHSACLQWDHFKFVEDKLTGSEDCLYLDIFTPSLKNDDQLYPVIVLIHGGAFMFGSGYGEWLRHDLIMKYENAVVVFFNYRLGPLGFLSTGDDIISGNMGLKDQRLALEWIKENIKSFNGNPDEIVLTGFSAGGASVHLHLLKPGIENLVSTAISFSGTALCPWVIVPQSVSIERTQKLAKHLNCQSTADNSIDIRECLKSKSGDEIVRAVGEFHEFLYNPFRVFGPVIESKSVENSFISDDVEKLIIEGPKAQIPWIVSFTSDEGGYNSGELMKQNANGEHENLHEFMENFEKLAPIVLFYGETRNNSETLEYSQRLLQKYNLNDENLTDIEKFKRLERMFTVELFQRNILRTIELHTHYSNSPLYAYQYNNSAAFGIGEILSNRTDLDFGTVHGDDVFLIFNLPARDQYPFRPDEEIISRDLIKMITDFAKTKIAKFGDVTLRKNEIEIGLVTLLVISTDDDNKLKLKTIYVKEIKMNV